MSAEGMTPGRGFEGGWLAHGLADDAVLECGVCWRVYDPKKGDRLAKVDPGVPFRDLPDTYHCPECDSPKEKFLLIDAGAGPKRGPEAHDRQRRLDALIKAYREADLAMASLPIYNPDLRIAALGFRPYQEGYLGALVTPWFMNIVLLPAQKQSAARASGAERAVAFPSGHYGFAAAHLDGVGAFEFLSLFSPMTAFDGQQAAQIAAEAALEALMTPPPPAPAAPTAEPTSRRTLLLGRSRPTPNPAPT
jgi:[NiFe] hydrogenase assembly HybE family chaperone